MGIVERNQKLTDVKKNEIIDGMERALLSKSYDRLTIDDVAKEAEYSKKTIYSYFKSKMEIYLELLIRKFDLLYKKLSNAISSSEIRGLEKIKILGKAYDQFAREYPEYMQAMINFDTKQSSENVEERELNERFNKETEKSFLLLEEAVKEAIEDKEIPEKTDVVGAAIVLWSQINGFVTLSDKKGEYIQNNYKKSIDELFDLNIEMMMHSLL